MIANFITGSRIIFSLAMLTFPVFSAGFYFFYMLAGFTDMIDGTIARKIASFAVIQEGFFRCRSASESYRIKGDKKCQEQETKRIYYSFQKRIIRSF